MSNDFAKVSFDNSDFSSELIAHLGDAQYKIKEQDKTIAELTEMLSGLITEYDELLGKAIDHVGSHGTSARAQAVMLLAKHKQLKGDNDE